MKDNGETEAENNKLKAKVEHNIFTHRTSKFNKERRFIFLSFNHLILDRFHFCWIRNLNGLVKTSSTNQTVFCINCEMILYKAIYI